MEQKVETKIENIILDLDSRGQSEELTSREQDLNKLLNNKNRYPVYIILGVGGIGSWVAYFCSKISSCEKIIMFDPDIVEETNLNRTPFRDFDVNSLKVEAISRIITEGPFDKQLVPINKKFIKNETCDYIKSNKNLINMFKHYDRYVRYICIDCRDNEFDDYSEIKQIEELIKHKIDIIRVAYDGFSVTLDLEPENNKSWGEGNGYSVDPSHVLPSSFAGLLAVLASFDYDNLKRREISKSHLTFNIFNIINFLYMGKIVSEDRNSHKTTAEELFTSVFKER